MQVYAYSLEHKRQVSKEANLSSEYFNWMRDYGVSFGPL